MDVDDATPLAGFKDKHMMIEAQIPDLRTGVRLQRGRDCAQIIAKVFQGLALVGRGAFSTGRHSGELASEAVG